MTDYDSLMYFMLRGWRPNFVRVPTMTAARTLTLNVEVSNKIPLRSAALEAAALANRLDVWVHFKFPAPHPRHPPINCYIAPNCKPEDVVTEFTRTLAAESLQYPDVVARPGGNDKWKEADGNETVTGG